MSFTFKQFAIDDRRSAMKVGTDGVLLGAWADCSGARQVLDVGSGSGLIALMIAQRCPSAQVIGIDIDPGAVADATANFHASPFVDRLTCMCISAAQYQVTERPDLIVCNPPYFATGAHSPQSGRAVARHEGTLNAAEMIRLASQWLAPEGSLAMVTPAEDEDRLVYLSEMHRLKLRRLCRVSTIVGRPPSRLLWQFSRSDGPPEVSSLAVRLPAGAYTPEYKLLTQDFYL